MANQEKPDPAHKGDWVWARAAYENTNASLRYIASEVGVEVYNVTSMAARSRWHRDEERIAAATAAVAVATELTTQKIAKQRKQDIELVSLEMQSRMLVKHRKTLANAEALCVRMFGELEGMLDFAPQLEQLGELMRAPNEAGVDKLNDLYNRILSLPERTKTLKNLGDTLKTFILLQRQAHGVSGALQDPEAEPVTPEVAGLDAVLTRFASVLAAKDELIAKDMGAVIIENAKKDDVTDVTPT